MWLVVTEACFDQEKKKITTRVFFNFSQNRTVRWPSGRRRSPAKGVYPLNGIEGSTPSLTAIIQNKKAQVKTWAFLFLAFEMCWWIVRG